MRVVKKKSDNTAVQMWCHYAYAGNTTTEKRMHLCMHETCAQAYKLN